MSTKISTPRKLAESVKMIPKVREHSSNRDESLFNDIFRLSLRMDSQMSLRSWGTADEMDRRQMAAYSTCDTR